MNILHGAPVGLLIVLAVSGITLAALLSAGEAAVIRVSRSAVSEIVENRKDLARRIRRLTSDPGQTAASAAFIRVFAEMLATACITICLAAVLSLWWLVLLLAVVLSALVALVLVRISPRTIGQHRPAQTLVVLSGLLSVVFALAGRITSLTSTARGNAVADDQHELREMVDRVNDSDVIEDEERIMLRSVFELGSTLTREVMVPRTDMVTCAAYTTLPKVLALFVRSGFSRIPVIGDGVDEMLGVVYFKDVVRMLNDAEDGEDRTVAKVMRQALFVPESKPVDDLLRELQLASSHMALVVDEYGGIAGLVTIEDIIEEIVGELTDEHDRAAPETEETSPGIYRVPSRLSLDDLGELFDLEIADDDVDTVGGLLAKALGKVPLAGATADTHGLHLAAERVEGRRKQLSTLLVSRSRDGDPDTTQERRVLDDTRADTRRTYTNQQETDS